MLLLSSCCYPYYCYYDILIGFYKKKFCRNILIIYFKSLLVRLFLSLAKESIKGVYFYLLFI